MRQILRRSRRLGAVGLMGAALIAAGCGGDDESSSSASAGESGQKTTSAKFMLEWAANASQIWAIAGKEKGEFAKAGIDPEFQFPDDSSTPVKALIAGKTDFALQLATGPVVARGEGADIRVIGTLEVLDVGLMVLEKDNINSFADLKGKTIGIGQSAWNDVCTERMLEASGMTKKDVKIVDPGYNLVAPLLANKFEGVNGSQYEQAIALAKQNAKTKIISFAPEVCPYSPIQIVTTKKMIDEKPEQVKAMLQGIANALAYSMEDPKGATAIFSKEFPDLDPKSDLAQWEASIPTFCQESSEEKGLLYSEEEQYTGLIKLAKEAGVIKKEYPVTDLVDNSFLPDPPVTEPCAGERYKDDPLSQITGL